MVVVWRGVFAGPVLMLCMPVAACDLIEKAESICACCADGLPKQGAWPQNAHVLVVFYRLSFDEIKVSDEIVLVKF